MKKITTVSLNGDLQFILDPKYLAEKEHIHTITDIQGLATIIQSLSEGVPVRPTGGYIIQ